MKTLRNPLIIGKRAKSVSRKRSAAQKVADQLARTSRKLELAKRDRAAQTSRKIALAKLSVGRTPVVNVKLVDVAVPQQVVTMTARLNRFLNGIDGETFLAHVPMPVTTVPEMPEVVICNGELYVQTAAAPLTYLFKPAVTAKRL